MPHKIHDVFGRITDDETSARSSILSNIRFAYCNGLYGDDANKALREFDEKYGKDTSLKGVYAPLSQKAKSQIRHRIENPTVGAHITNDKGERRRFGKTETRVCLHDLSKANSLVR